MNHIALAGSQRIAVCRHDHTQCGAAVPFQLDLIEPTRRCRHHHIIKIGLQPHHDGLGFGVAHAAIEFQRFGFALGVNHQARIQKAGKRDAVFFHAPDGGQDDFAHGPGMHFRRHDWCR